MKNYHTIKCSEHECWDEVVRRCDMYDIYHLAGYHQLAEEQNNVQAILFVYEEKFVVIGMPLLLRELDDVDGIEKTGYFDATSVYGYPGPITNVPDIPEDIADNFLKSLHNYLESKGVVSILSRLHPILDQKLLLAGVGEVINVGPTAAIDLTLPIDVQRQHYRTDHKYRINKAEREGIICIHDKEWEHFDTFIDVYTKTMQRVSADNYYYFDYDYFYRLRELLGNHLHLFIALQDGSVISGALFTVCNSVMQYHLSGTYSKGLDLSPNRIILDTARLWGTKIGARVLHLGGGVGGKKDGLFEFKAGFSKQSYQFNIWCAIINQDAYQALTEQRQSWNEQRGLEIADENYFPIYRAPTRKKVKEIL